MPLTTDEQLLALSRETIAVFDKANGGVHPGFRPAHAKGILLRGTFMPSPEAASLTRAPHLHRSSTPVTVRFSDFAGIPTIADNDPQSASPRGFAVRFHLGEHVHTDIIGHSVDNFPVRTAEGLVEFLNAVIATDPKGPHPNAIEQFLGAHPAAMRFVQIPKPIPTSFARESFLRSPRSSSPTQTVRAATGATGCCRSPVTNISARPKRRPAVQTFSSTRSKSVLQGDPLDSVSSYSWQRSVTRSTMPRFAGPRIVRNARLAKSACSKSCRITPASSNTSSLIRSREWTASKHRPTRSSSSAPTSI
jgi:hypothetical protein